MINPEFVTLADRLLNQEPWTRNYSTLDYGLLVEDVAASMQDAASEKIGEIRNRLLEAAE